MPAPKRKSERPTKTPRVLLAEEHVIIRLCLATHLRGCGYVVFEAASADEARSVLLAGPKVDILFADAQLAGGENGFALATWVRRHRPQVSVTLTGTLAGKAEAAANLCEKRRKRASPQEAQILADHIRAMMAEHDRRARRPSSATISQPRLRKRG